MLEVLVSLFLVHLSIAGQLLDLFLILLVEVVLVLAQRLSPMELSSLLSVELHLFLVMVDLQVLKLALQLVDLIRFEYQKLLVLLFLDDLFGLGEVSFGANDCPSHGVLFTKRVHCHVVQVTVFRICSAAEPVDHKCNNDNQ